MKGGKDSETKHEGKRCKKQYTKTRERKGRDGKGREGKGRETKKHG